MRALGAAFALCACACGGKKSPPRLEGDLPIAFGDCADVSVRFVSGPLPLPLSPFFAEEDASGGTGTAMALDEGKMGKKEGAFGGYVVHESHIGVGGNYGPIPGPRTMRPRLPDAPRVSIGQPEVTGDLDKAIIRRYLKRNVQRIVYCYEKQLAVKPSLAGVVQTQFFIAPTGRVTSSNASGPDPVLATCVAEVIGGIEFPKPKDGAGVQVSYPFTFQPPEHAAAANAPPPPPVEPRPTTATIDPKPLGRALFRSAASLPSGRIRYTPGGVNPLRYAREPIEECLRRSPERFGAIAVEKSRETIAVHGVADESTRACLADAIATAKLSGLHRARCPLAFGSAPAERMPGFDVSDAVAFGKPLIATNATGSDATQLTDTTIAQAVVGYRAAAVADGSPVVALHGPLVIRADPATPMRVVLRLASTIVSSDDDFVLAVKREDRWQLLDDIALPLPPMPLGAGGRWSRLATAYAPHVVDEERASLSILVEKDRVWVNVSRVGTTEAIPRDKLLAKLEEHKASAFFSDRRDVQIAANDDVRYADFVAVVDAAVRAGFVDWQLTDEGGLAAPPPR